MVMIVDKHSDESGKRQSPKVQNALVQKYIYETVKEKM